MARKELKDNSKLRELMEEYGEKTMDDVNNFVKMVAAETIQTALDAELENDLGYCKYDLKSKRTDNSQNGCSKKRCREVRETWKSTYPGTGRVNMSRSW